MKRDRMDMACAPSLRRPVAPATTQTRALGGSAIIACAAPSSRRCTLVTNCVMAWNTLRLQHAVDREAQRTAPRYSIEALRGIGPVGHRRINLRGIYRFPIDRYAHRLVPSVICA